MNLSQESKLEILSALIGGGTCETKQVSGSPYEVGKKYHIRTVTMAIAGTLKAVYEQELVFEKASWVADTGRFSTYLKDTSKISENEPFKYDVIVGRAALIDCTMIDTVQLSVK